MVELRADCARCVGLCCVAPGFARSADFAIDKPAGIPCAHLQANFRCAVHADLRGRGFAGCTIFDCLGAGQRVTAAFAGQDWHTPGLAGPMFAAFAVARQIHELLWYLDEARVRAPDPALEEEWARLSVGDDLVDVAAARERVGELLRGASERLRIPADGESRVSTRRGVVLSTASRRFENAESGIPTRGAPDSGGRPAALPHPPAAGSDGGRPRDHSRADLAGVRWRGADLRRASLRGALLLGADLRGADLRLADLLGADLRGADLRGADLSTSLFVTPMQAGAAQGDVTTRLPERIPRPAHWSD